ncbi:ribosome maturation factor RimM [Eupransor demetentiae]|uniref:Ribosome maturation factor RimM n=1 Tax=Eupransor demetentiae TaxID=3109584 RepID=A0ABM9N4V1_9LACO|nr:Ribosomal 30S subunit maturation factor RimM [Lactobacillaceae bacterium LMG 33000]
MNKETLYKVGQIVNTHGIRGEVKVAAITDFAAERFAPGAQLQIKTETGYQEEVVASSRQHKGMWLVKFEGLDNINDVEHFKGDDLYVDGQERSDLADGEYYYDEIIGCEVLDENQQVLGEITSVMPTGANDVWVMRQPNGKEGLIPVIDDVVKNVDVANKKITIEVLEGLFD